MAFHYTYWIPGYTYWIAGQWGVPTVQVFPLVYHVTQYGRFGVELFFVISGFVVCMSAWGRPLAPRLKRAMTAAIADISTLDRRPQRSE